MSLQTYFAKGFLSHGGTPKSSIFMRSSWIFPHKPSSYWGTPITKPPVQKRWINDENGGSITVIVESIILSHKMPGFPKKMEDH